MPASSRHNDATCDVIYDVSMLWSSAPVAGWPRCRDLPLCACVSVCVCGGACLGRDISARRLLAAAAAAAGATGSGQL